MSNTTNFFEQKKPWSIYKDKILGYYLTPYIVKILYTKKPLVIIDCFAGKGKFNDDIEGSPIIIAKQISKYLDRNIQGYFIENKYYKDLRDNLNGFSNCNILQGTFEENIKNILSLPSNRNLFLYVDPYGVKSLSMSQFKKIKEKGFNSMEMLMNFNSFGFLREGCRLLKYKDLFNDADIDSEYETDDNDDIEIWNKIADGDYWENLLVKFKDKKIDMYQCEEMFVKDYIVKLGSIFDYVVNIPIKIKENNIPKYRLIFGTNHYKGLFLMVDNMNKAWNQIKEHLHQNKQLLLFDIGKANNNEIIDNIIMILSDERKVLLIDVIIKLIQEYGIQFSIAEYIKLIKSLINKDVEIEHVPATTNTGRPVKSMDFDEYTIYIKKKKR